MMLDRSDRDHRSDASGSSHLSDSRLAIAHLLSHSLSLSAAAAELTDLVVAGCEGSGARIWSFTEHGPVPVASSSPVIGRPFLVARTGRSFDSIAEVGVPCQSVPIEQAGLWVVDLRAVVSAGVEREIAVRFGGVGDGMGVLVVHDASADDRVPMWLDEIADQLTQFLARVNSAETLQACVASYQVLFDRAARTARLADDDRLHRMLDTLALFAVVIDTNGDVTFMNATMLDRLGRSLDDVVGRGLFADVPHDAPADDPGRDEVQRTVLAVIESEQIPADWTNDIALPDGTTMTVRWSSTFIRGDDGQIHALMSVGEDITERAATAERLAESVQMETVGRLTGGVAHDFNNFLTVIKGHTDLARAAPRLTDDVTPHLDQIDHATRRATTLIRQLLAFGRHTVPDPVTISVSAELDQLAALLRPTFRSSIVIDVVADTADDLVKFDRSRIDQIFVNLAFNARDAMPLGGVITYTVSDELVDPERAGELEVEPGPYVVVKVADDGLGIDPSIIDHVFERDVTSKAVGEGGGLGLWTVLGVITQAGGAITVDTERKSGTEFTLYFRRSTGELTA